MFILCILLFMLPEMGVLFSMDNQVDKKSISLLLRLTALPQLLSNPTHHLPCPHIPITGYMKCEWVPLTLLDIWTLSYQRSYSGHSLTHGSISLPIPSTHPRSDSCCWSLSMLHLSLPVLSKIRDKVLESTVLFSLPFIFLSEFLLQFSLLFSLPRVFLCSATTYLPLWASPTPILKFIFL